VASNLGSISKLLVANRQARVCFSNPFSGRRWLNLLEPHPRYGLLFKRNLNYSKRVLGFSFATNNLGFRGPSNPEAPGVIFGTSFAMGLSVDNGDNWYELLLDPDKWFNGGMPVGPRNNANVLDDLYRGSYDTLIYLYHPNIWKTAQGFVRAEKTGKDIFQTLGWKTGFWQTLSLYPKWVAKEFYKTKHGWSVHSKWNGQDFFFNSRYNLMDVPKNLEFAKSQMSILNSIFARFKTVLVVRYPIKEDIAGRLGFSDDLRTLAVNNDEWWNFFVSNAAPSVRTHSLMDGGFESIDFHPYDTHWTANGNQKFTELLRPLLMAAHVDGVKQR